MIYISWLDDKINNRAILISHGNCCLHTIAKKLNMIEAIAKLYQLAPNTSFVRLDNSGDFVFTHQK